MISQPIEQQFLLKGKFCVEEIKPDQKFNLKSPTQYRGKFCTLHLGSFLLDVVSHTCNPIIWAPEAGGLPQIAG